MGRENSCLQLERLLQAACDGQGGRLSLVGDPGVGKTALLEFAVQRAVSMRVLRARGVSAENAVPYAAISELIDPILSMRQDLTPSQDAALGAAMAVGPPVPWDRFALCTATLALLLAASSTKPLLLAIDDAQWLDEASVEVLAFTIRRLARDRVAVLITARSGELPAAFADFQELHVDGLDEASAAQLLERQDHLKTLKQLSWFMKCTGGNPLALLDLPRLLSDREALQLASQGEPAPVGQFLEEAYGRTLAELPAAVREALTVAAVLDGEDLRVVSAALASADLAPAELEPAEDARMVEISPEGVKFRHGLIRSAVFQIAGPSQRRRAHRCAAAGLQAAGGRRGAESAAWHLAAASIAPDESVAEALEKCAADAQARGGFQAAALSYARAANLSELTFPRIRRTLAAASAFLLAGSFSEADSLLRLAAAAEGSAEHETEIAHLRGRIETWNGAPGVAAARLYERALTVRAHDARLSAQMLSDAAVAAVISGQTRLAMKAGKLILELSTVLDPLTELTGRMLTGISQALRGERAHALADLDYVRAGLTATAPTPGMLPQLIYLADAYSWIDCFEVSSALFDVGIRMARELGAIGLLPHALNAEAVLKFHTGAWDAAYAGASEGLQLASDTNRAADRGHSLGVLALVEAGRGLPAARDHARESISLSAAIGAGIIEAQSHSILGHFELGAGNTSAGIAALRRCREMAFGLEILEFGHLQWAPELIEAYVRQGDVAAAVPVLAELDVATERNGGPMIAAMHKRCAALMAQDGYEELFVQALELHRLTARPFETARTQLCYGEQLRRHRRRRDARAQLEAAWTTFSALGARSWAARAATEISATGLPRPPERTRPADVLTPQELQIALRVAAGASNRDAAGALFLSPKTVEYHLGNTYRKLGIRSRDDLARALNI